MSARKIERMLAAAGVPEGAHPPYLTTARAMFAAAAWNALHTVPEGTDADALVANARYFCENFWGVFQGRWTVERYPVLGRHSVTPDQRGHLQPRQGMAFVGGAVFMPSVRSATPVRHVTARDADTVSSVAEDLLADSIAELREHMSGYAIRPSDGGAVSRWSGTGVEVVVEGHVWKAVSWTSLELLCKDMDDLLHEVGYAPPLLDEAVGRRDAMLRAHPGIKAALDGIAEASGLPVRFGLAPYPERGHGNGHRDAALILHGYGPGGEAAAIQLGGLGPIKGVDEWRERIGQEMVTQARRHAQYGPAPSSGRGDWQLDLVSARLLIQAADGPEALAAAIARGSAKAETVALRICGRTPHRLLGSGQITPEALWRGDELRIVGKALPETVMATLVGRPVDEVVASPLLKGAGTITGVRMNTLRGKPRVNIKVRPTMKALNLGGRSDSSQNAIDA